MSLALKHEKQLSSMQKYFKIFSLSWQNGFVYRVSLLLWRTRQFLSSLMSLTLWTVIFSSSGSAFGYTQSEMITYIFLASFLQSIILATALHPLSGKVYSGEITNQLLKPVSLFGYFAIEDVADKLRNMIFILIETAILFAIFQPVLPPMPSLPMLGLFLVLTVFGAVMHFFIELLFGSLGFWSPDTWGPKFLFFMFVDFTAGKLYPLDIMPEFLQKILFLTPFPYFSFVQTQVFLQKITFSGALQHVLVLGGWTIGLALLASWIWKRGMRDYAAAGQ